VSAADRLVREPVAPLGVTYDDDAVARLLRLSGRHPFFTQRLCNACVEVLNADRSGLHVGVQQVIRAAELCLGTGPEDTLATYWADAGDAGRDVLRAVARLGGPDGEWVAYSELAAQHDGGNGSLEEALGGLGRQGVLDCERARDGQAARCRYQIDLLRIWAQRNEPEARPW